MHRALPADKSPDRCVGDLLLHHENSIGSIFRDYGEAYIRSYATPVQHIKLIRSMRLCKSPGMGGKAYACKSCGVMKYVYFGCGQSHCSICQCVKREQWLEKMSKELLDVPYVHLITTLPHQLNSIARNHPRAIYGLMLSVTNQTVQLLSKDSKHLGAKPGLISVLHTFGSDMKYHVHVHSLMTFGGITKEGEWRFPKDKKKLCKNKLFRDTFRDLFLKRLEALIDKGEIRIEAYQYEAINELRKKTWSFHATRPTLQTKSIELYLARYINRIAITNSRVQYLKQTEEVRIVYNDYKNQEEGKPAPKDHKLMEPLVFIGQYLQHIPPPYFHKVRHYGIHNSACKKKYSKAIKSKVRENGETIRTVMEIITHLLKVPVLRCSACQKEEFEIYLVTPDKRFKYSFLTLPQKSRSP